MLGELAKGLHFQMKRHISFPQTGLWSSSRWNMQAQNRKVHLPLPSFFFFLTFIPLWVNVSFVWSLQGVRCVLDSSVCTSKATLCFSLLSSLPFEADLVGWYQWASLPPVFLLSLANGDHWWESGKRAVRKSYGVFSPWFPPCYVLVCWLCHFVVLCVVGAAEVCLDFSSE